MEDNTLRRAMLFDFYGDLLTDKQREYYDLHYNEDLSLGEIAEQSGISRQGVWDIIRRADKILSETEEKTGLVSRFQRLRVQVDEISALVEKARDAGGDSTGLLAEVLQRLEAKNFIIIEPDKADRRCKRIRLTDRARRCDEAVGQAFETLEQRMCAGMTEAEQQTLRRLLDLAAENLKITQTMEVSEV